MVNAPDPVIVLWQSVAEGLVGTISVKGGVGGKWYFLASDN